MRHDSRLSGVVHLLLHLAEADGPVSSEVLARAMDTNAVVVRRVLAGLREAGIVLAGRGAGGGWSLGVDVAALTLRDVHEALGGPAVVAMGHRSGHPRCGVEQVVNETLDRAFADAESRFLESLSAVSLALLQAEFRRRARRAASARGAGHATHDVRSAHA